MSPPRDPSQEATIGDIIDAVVLYDAPVFDYRFQEIVSRHPDPTLRRQLLDIPARVVVGARTTRAAGHEWERVTSPVLVESVVTRSERLLLQTFLDSAEGQIRLKAFLARHAPTEEVRSLIDDAIGIHREATTVLRKALNQGGDPGHGQPTGKEKTASSHPRYTQCEDESGDILSQVERAIRSMRATGREPRGITVSHVALRHLRDQGALRDGQSQVMGVPVDVDLSWDASEFALHSFDTVPLEEMLDAAKRR